MDRGGKRLGRRHETQLRTAEARELGDPEANVAYRRMIRKWCHGAGLDVRRYRPLTRDPFAAQSLLFRNRPCRTIFDLGAYQGEITQHYSELFPTAQIWSFEPFPQSYEKLTARFGANPRIKLVNAAVSGETGEATFYVNRMAATNSLLARPTSGRRYYPEQGSTVQALTVPTVSLDQYRQEHQIAAPEILKMDIQGNELAALSGAESTLSEGATDVIYTEVSFVPHYERGALFHEVCTYLTSRGFSLFGIYDLHWAPIGQLRFGDAIFVSDRIRTSVIDHLPDE
jgi:FkbM family methyltransferase